jgi:hypothetical protein
VLFQCCTLGCKDEQVDSNKNTDGRAHGQGEDDRRIEGALVLLFNRVGVGPLRNIKVCGQRKEDLGDDCQVDEKGDREATDQAVQLLIRLQFDNDCLS